MFCLICHGKSKNLPKYACGHYFHGACLKKWASHTDTTEKGEKMITRLPCPYCNQKIDLYKKTRLDNNFYHFYNNLRWLLRIYDILTCDYEETLTLSEHEKGICQICENKDNIFIMKIKKPNTHIWLCNTCQTQEDREKRVRASYDKSKYEIMNKIMNFCWDNRQLIRKNVKFTIMVQNKSKEFIENISNEMEINSDINNEDKIKLKNLGKISQKLLKYNF